MTCACVSAPRAQQAFVVENFEGRILDVITGSDRVYVLSSVSDRGADMQFSDPLDGELLVECRCFPDETAARQWIAADIELRNTRMGGVH